MTNRLKYTTGLLLITSFLFASCERAANIPLPKADPKLVIGCFISPDDTVLQASVTLSNPLYNTQLGNTTYVPDATVSISDGTTTVYLLPTTISGDEFYVSAVRALPIVPGRTYMLKVTTPAGMSVSASCQVPLHQVSDITYDLLQRDDEVVLNASIQDIPGEKNYYRIDAFIRFRDPFGPGGFYENEFYFQTSERKDEGQDGGKISFTNGSSYGPSGPANQDQLKIFVMTCDEHYYRYHLSLSNYEGDNPFAEPVLIYSNINGGLGVFGAYRTVSKIVQL